MQLKPDYLSVTYDMFLSSVRGEEHKAVRFDQWVTDVEQDDAYAFESCRTAAQTSDVVVRRTNGEHLPVINLASYNYLGYACHPEVVEAAKAALDRYGLGPASSPVHGGAFEVHQQLEQALCDFIGLDGRGASLFTSGYAVNVGTISALMKRRQLVLMDRSAHMSVMEGAQLSRAKMDFFNHNDPEDLRRALEEASGKARRVLVCTEGVFSADGDYGALAEIVKVAKEYDAMVLVDEAHSFGVAGPGGRGVAEAAGVLDQVDLLVVTFSKALGGVGGALIARREVARYVNWYARCRMFSCALDPAVTGGVLRSVQLAGGADGHARRKRLHDNAAYLRHRLRGNVDLGLSESWIVTVMYGPEERTIPLLDYLQRQGLDGSIMQFPAVAINESRVRLFITSEHTHEQLDRAAEIIIQAADKFGFLHN